LLRNNRVNERKKQTNFDAVEEAFGNFNVAISVLFLAFTNPVSLRVKPEADSDDLRKKVGCCPLERLES
jgi:hypothetical protein